MSELLDEIDDSPSTSIVVPKRQHKEELKTKNQVVRDYMKTFREPVLKINNNKEIKLEPKSVLMEIQNKDETLINEPKDEVLEKTKVEIKQDETVVQQESVVENDCFNDDLDMTQLEEMEKQQDFSNDLQAEFLTEWENKVNDEDDEPTNIEAPISNNKQSLKFFWWDAYEDPDRQKGVVYLFGKTFCEKTKNFVSCCIAVRDIPRRIFVLPHQYELDEYGKQTDKLVTQSDLYTEFNEKIMKPMNITAFKSKFVSKKYAFNPQIPTESEYMEVQYAAKYPAINLDSYKLRTICNIFGTNSSYLEILLLQRKIKGPCWLDINEIVPVSNPISWCAQEYNCFKLSNITITQSNDPLMVPPLIVVAINLRTVINPKTMHNEVVMMSCLVQKKYFIDKKPPVPPFQQHFCGKSVFKYLIIVFLQ